MACPRTLDPGVWAATQQFARSHWAPCLPVLVRIPPLPTSNPEPQTPRQPDRKHSAQYLNWPSLVQLRPLSVPIFSLPHHPLVHNHKSPPVEESIESECKKKGQHVDLLLISFLSTSSQKEARGIFLSSFRRTEGRGEDCLSRLQRSPIWTLKPASRSPSVSSRHHTGKLRPPPKPTPTKS